MSLRRRTVRKVVASIGTLILVSLLLGACGNLALLIGSQRTTIVPFPPMQLYVTDAPNGTKLIPIDPHTLADLEAGPAIETGSPLVSASADGGTLAAIVYPHNRVVADLPASDITIRILSAHTGAERTRFNPPAHVNGPRLTPDGARLIAKLLDGPEWYVFDTSDGRLLSTIQTEDMCCELAWIDPVGRTLYRMIVPDSPQASAAQTPLLVKYDLASGEEVDRLTLDGVSAGWWQTEREINGFPVPRYANPGIALSPDGRRLAVLHADGETLTMVDAERLEAVQTTLLSRPANPLGWLGLIPNVAHAKFAEGVSWDVHFSPDGRRLYATGLESRLDEDEGPSYRGLGLRVIEVERGAIVAEALADERIDWVVPAPDGGAVYAFGLRQTQGSIPMGSSTYLLRRLDAATLEITAEREFTGYRELFILTAPTQ